MRGVLPREGNNRWGGEQPGSHWPGSARVLAGQVPGVETVVTVEGLARTSTCEWLAPRGACSRQTWPRNGNEANTIPPPPPQSTSTVRFRLFPSDSIALCLLIQPGHLSIVASRFALLLFHRTLELLSWPEGAQFKAVAFRFGKPRQAVGKARGNPTPCY